jgi:hypothetical protein
MGREDDNDQMHQDGGKGPEPTDRVLLRAACRLREQVLGLNFAQVKAVSQTAGLLVSALAELGALRRQLTVACGRGWRAAADRIAGRIERLTHEVQHHADSVQQAAGARRATVPSVRELLAEFRQLQDEFPSVGFGKGGELSAETEPVELEGIYLGPFRIVLDVAAMGEGKAVSGLRVVAMDPNPAGCNDEVTHPHVSGERLCAGDATAPINAAMAEGRICDLFLLVRGVLTTYNASSPFVSLDNWQGEPCSDCGRTIGGDDSRWCSACEREYCDDCVTYCHVCDETTCLGCRDKCPVCDESTCPSCMTTCPYCHATICKNCLAEQQCPCQEDKENEDDDQREEQVPVAAAAPAAAPSESAPAPRRRRRATGGRRRTRRSRAAVQPAGVG